MRHDKSNKSACQIIFVKPNIREEEAMLVNKILLLKLRTNVMFPNHIYASMMHCIMRDEKKMLMFHNCES